MHRAAGLVLALLIPGCIFVDDECDPGPDVFPLGPLGFLPPPRATWQWQLSDLPVDTSACAAVYDVDLFTTGEDEIRALHDTRPRRGVICNFSAGSFQSERPDSDAFPEDVKGEPLDPPFEDELWLDVRSQVVREIMRARLELAMNKGCDGVEPDNVDGYANQSGFDLSAQDQIDFNIFLAEEAHAHGLSVGLKNDVDQLADLVEELRLGAQRGVLPPRRVRSLRGHLHRPGEGGLPRRVRRLGRRAPIRRGLQRDRGARPEHDHEEP
jgi:hypothetical protein